MNAIQWYTQVRNRQELERNGYREALGFCFKNILGLCDLVYSYAILYEFVHHEDALFMNPPMDVRTLDYMLELISWKKFIGKHAGQKIHSLASFSHVFEQCNRSICFWSEEKCRCDRPLTREFIRGR